MPLMFPASEQSPGLKGVCVIAVMSVISSVFYVIIFFGQDRPQSEGSPSRHTHPGIKTPPVFVLLLLTIATTTIGDWSMSDGPL